MKTVYFNQRIIKRSFGKQKTGNPELYAKSKKGKRDKLFNKRQ